MEHFNTATRYINECQETLFPRLESCRDSVAASVIESTINERIKQLEEILERLEIALAKAQPTQRQSLKFKLDQLKYDHKAILTSFRSLHQRRLTREREQREREELLSHRFTTNEATHRSVAGGSHSSADTHISMDQAQAEYYDNEKSRLHSFNRSIDELLSTGGAVLSNLRDQGSALRATRSRILEVGATLGLSNSVMRLIEKRILTDKFILFGGMFLFTFLMWLIWKYLT